MRQVIKGNHAVSHGVRLSRVKVISAYPITPQTTIVEELSEMCAKGSLRAKFIKVESEHSALAALIGSATAGVRSFTATSSQGLLLMHEVLHWVCGARLPIVLANVNRAVGAGWNIWADQTDSISQRDTGWIQIYCESNQEVLDSIIMAYKLAETILLPVMITYDAFFLSHTSEVVDIPSQSEVDEFLPPFQPPYRIDISNPKTFGGMMGPELYYEERYLIYRDSMEALDSYTRICEQFHDTFARHYEPAEAYGTEDADIVVVTAGTITSVARLAVEEARKKGIKMGLMKLRLFRPVPVGVWRTILSHVPKIVVIDRNLSGGLGGVFASELRSALYGLDSRPLIYSAIAGLGGRDVTPADVMGVVEYVLSESPSTDVPIFWGLKGQQEL